MKKMCLSMAEQSFSLVFVQGNEMVCTAKAKNQKKTVVYKRQIWNIFIEQENSLPEDMVIHLAEVITRSWGRCCHGQPLHRFRRVWICIHKWRPSLGVRKIFVCHMTGWECFCYGAVGGHAAAPPPSLLASGSGNVDTQSGAQPQKPQESSWEDAGREREVEPWNALRRVSHLFTSWTQWTLSESTTSTLTSLPHLSLPLSPLFCSLTYPYASGLLTPPLPSSYW